MLKRQVSLVFGATFEIQIELDTDGKQHTVQERHHQGGVPIYFDGDSLCGTVSVSTKGVKELQHRGIRVELCGIIEVSSSRSCLDEFMCLKHDLALPGIISQKNECHFKFTKVAMPFESYSGTDFCLKYFLRVVINKFLGSVTKECPIVVYCPTTDIATERCICNLSLRDSLKFNVEYDKQQYHLQDVIVGQVCFLQLLVKVDKVKLYLVKHETLRTDDGYFNDTKILASHEIMEGNPAHNECIPFRLCLSRYTLSPTFRNIRRRLSVRYHIKVVVRDETKLRYAYQQEILFYRRLPPSDGINQPDGGETVGTDKSPDASTEPRASDIQLSNDKLATEVQPHIDSNSAESQSTLDEMDRSSGSCRIGSEDVDGVNAVALARDLFVGAGVNEVEYGEQDRQTSDTDVRAAENMIFIGNDSKAAVPPRQHPLARTGKVDSFDIDGTFLEGFKQTHGL